MRQQLTDVEIDQLARYNAEVWRGLVHTPEYDERMAELQARFDAEYGDVPIGGAA